MPYPITELFAWIIDDPAQEHGVIAFSLNRNLTFAQAVTSERRIADKVKPIAIQAAAVTCLSVKLQRFALVETIDEIKAPC